MQRIFRRNEFVKQEDNHQTAERVTKSEQWSVIDDMIGGHMRKINRRTFAESIHHKARDFFFRPFQQQIIQQTVFQIWLRILNHLRRVDVIDSPNQQRPNLSHEIVAAASHQQQPRTPSARTSQRQEPMIEQGKRKQGHEQCA